MKDDRIPIQSDFRFGDRRQDNDDFLEYDEKVSISLAFYDQLFLCEIVRGHSNIT